MTDITEFLLGRLSDEESNARRYLDLTPEGHLAPVFNRLLREVWIKRQVIDLAWEDALSIEGEWGEGRGRHQMTKAGDAPAIVRVLAQIYDNHPDYNPEWSTA